MWLLLHIRVEYRHDTEFCWDGGGGLAQTFAVQFQDFCVLGMLWALKIVAKLIGR